jgi:hypothetical protein
VFTKKKTIKLFLVYFKIYNFFMEFIKQTDNYTCSLITILNACVFKNKTIPFKYPSDEYFNFFNDSKTKNNTFYDEKIYDLTGIKKDYFKGDGRSFHKWFHTNILKGNPIDFSGYCNGLHSFLVCDYNEEKDSYMCVGSNMYSENIVEWLPYALIIRGNFGCNKISSFIKIKINNINKSSSALIFNK